MKLVVSLVGIAGEEVDKMKDSVKALSGQTAQAPAKLADAMFFIQSAGLRGATAMETLEASAKAAAVGLGEVEQIADLARNKKWGSAAKRLDAYVAAGGTPRDKAVAARVFLTASYLAACRARPCNMGLATKYANQAAELPDVLRGRVTNARWAGSVGQFKNCDDVNLKGLCQAVGKELR